MLYGDLRAGPVTSSTARPFARERPAGSGRARPGGCCPTTTRLRPAPVRAPRPARGDRPRRQRPRRRPAAWRERGSRLRTTAASARPAQSAHASTCGAYRSRNATFMAPPTRGAAPAWPRPTPGIASRSSTASKCCPLLPVVEDLLRRHGPDSGKGVQPLRASPCSDEPGQRLRRRHRLTCLRSGACRSGHLRRGTTTWLPSETWAAGSETPGRPRRVAPPARRTHPQIRTPVDEPSRAQRRTAPTTWTTRRGGGAARSPLPRAGDARQWRCHCRRRTARRRRARRRAAPHRRAHARARPADRATDRRHRHVPCPSPECTKVWFGLSGVYEVYEACDGSSPMPPRGTWTTSTGTSCT